MKSERRDYAAICGIRGIVNPITTKYNKIPASLEALLKIQNDWRSLLDNVRNSEMSTKYLNANDNKIYEACYNCRVALIAYESDEITSCGKPTICPFCNCRELESTFRTISDKLPKEREKLETLNFYVYSNVEYVDKDTDLAPKLATVSDCRNYLNKRLKPLGAVYNSTISTMLSRFSNKLIFKLSHKALMLFPKDKKIFLLPDEGKMTQLEKVDRKNLCHGLAIVFRYPAELLTSPPETLVSILDARSNLRMSALYGNFRNYARNTSKKR